MAGSTAHADDALEQSRRLLDAQAEQYVRLALALGGHDPAYVDAYYGPEEWREEALREQAPLSAIAARADAVIAALSGVPGDAGDVLDRSAFLVALVSSLRARTATLLGTRLTFDAEARALYDVVPPIWPDSHFDAIRAELEALVPGQGALAARLERYRAEHELPRGCLAEVFHAAIEECRRRTREHVDLPAEERFDLEFVQDRPWSGYNWYAGGYRSRIQVNTDLPVHLDRVIDLAAHEGYPGHHVHNVLIEAHLVRAGRRVELTVFPLFSPLALIAEGAANFGIDVAFPGESREQFERDVLVPMAGLAGVDVARYRQVLRLAGRLSHAADGVARLYLDGDLDRDMAVDALSRCALMTPERAAQRVRFFDAYRSYVVNYTVGLDLVRACIERRLGSAGDTDRRWEEYARLLLTPVPPSWLQ